MPKLTKSFPQTLFPLSFVESLIAEWREKNRAWARQFQGTGVTMDMSDGQLEDWARASVTGAHMRVDTPDGTWVFQDLEEALLQLRQPYNSVWLELSSPHGPESVSVTLRWSYQRFEVEISHADRLQVERLAARFADAADAVPAPAPIAPRPRIFIGHGRNAQWRILKDFLHHQLNYDVEAYETLPRAGHDIHRVLEEMLDASSFALLVMTAEDEQADESVRARQNVVHETGLFQGRLGFERALVLLEAGTEDYSNLAGTQQLRFPAGNIEAIHGDVVATLLREFPPSS